MDRNVGYIFVGSGDEFFCGPAAVLSGINWRRLYSDRRMWVLLANISLRLEIWFCGDYVERFGSVDKLELTGSHWGPDMDRTRKDKGA